VLAFLQRSISPPERFAAIAAAFAANFEGIVIPSPDAGWGVPERGAEFKSPFLPMQPVAGRELDTRFPAAGLNSWSPAP
jgi:hypothetical protein